MRSSQPSFFSHLTGELRCSELNCCIDLEILLENLLEVQEEIQEKSPKRDPVRYSALCQSLQAITKHTLIVYDRMDEETQKRTLLKLNEECSVALREAIVNRDRTKVHSGPTLFQPRTSRFRRRALYSMDFQTLLATQLEIQDEIRQDPSRTDPVRYEALHQALQELAECISSEFDRMSEETQKRTLLELYQKNPERLTALREAIVNFNVTRQAKKEALLQRAAEAHRNVAALKRKKEALLRRIEEIKQNAINETRASMDKNPMFSGLSSEDKEDLSHCMIEAARSAYKQTLVSEAKVDLHSEAKVDLHPDLRAAIANQDLQRSGVFAGSSSKSKPKRAKPSSSAKNKKCTIM